VKTPLEIIYVPFPIDKMQNPKIKILSKFGTKEKLPYFVKVRNNNKKLPYFVKTY